MILDKLLKARHYTKTVNATKRLLSERGESNAASMASDLIENFNTLEDDQIAEYFQYLSEKLNPSAADVLSAAQMYAATPNADNLIWLMKVAESPRQELLRRLNRAPSGTSMIVKMRHHLLKLLPKKPELKAVDADIQHLLTSWFNPGFLKMHQVDWKSPAHILEKIIQHEAVHEIDGWDDLRRRLQPDRRCFSFFHPQLSDEPLIFVEVALLPDIPEAIAPLVDKKTAVIEPNHYKCAIFYSISNCQPGLRGVSMGNFLIKRVAESLKKEFPGLKTFCTLSPIPGFMEWLSSSQELSSENLKPAMFEKYQESIKVFNLQEKSWSDRLHAGWHPDAASVKEKEALMSLCAFYLMTQSSKRGGNSVAKFHLGNGAKLHRVNWAGDLSKKGIKQSAGLMVNYLYDLDNVEDNHERFVNGEIIYSRAVSQLI
ncbi:malonyl-CoA decarboxylase [Polynucleobacter sp. 30F-ANTBAC]|jgi:malonyl-CoA decarboxylase|uniref:malonyl-CoA decarboxylase n=1 Tax=Polynucleobacter sp. 30F-ANTBAC TaxID=2689095 RepID=UPI001C20C993|nr:malonyl-CoA decarboxylase [Polynucleobacter sp. 30F-ANTBAC]